MISIICVFCVNCVFYNLLFGVFFLNSDKWHNTLMVMCNRITWGRLLLSLASCTPSFFPFSWFSWLFASFPSLAMQFLIQEKQLPFYTKNSFKTACLKILLKINQPHFKNNAWFMTTWRIKVSFYTVHNVWKSPKLSHLRCLEFWHFPSIFVLLKVTCNTVWLQATSFKQKLAQIDHFWVFLMNLTQ